MFPVSLVSSTAQALCVKNFMQLNPTQLALAITVHATVFYVELNLQIDMTSGCSLTLLNTMCLLYFASV